MGVFYSIRFQENFVSLLMIQNVVASQQMLFPFCAGSPKERKHTKILHLKVLKRNTGTATNPNMQSTGILSAIRQSNASSLQGIAQVVWTLTISLRILKKQSGAEDEAIGEDTKLANPVPVGGLDSPIPVGDTESLVTGGIIKHRIEKCMDAGEERSMAGNSEDTAGKSDVELNTVASGALWSISGLCKVFQVLIGISCKLVLLYFS